MKLKLAWAAFAAALAAALGLRFAQLSTAETWGPLGMALCVILAAGAAACLLAFRQDRTAVRLPLTGRLLGIAYITGGALLSAVAVVFQAWNHTGKYVYETGIGTVLAVAAGLVLFLQGCLFVADGQNFFANHQVLALLPVLWCCVELLVQFQVNTAEPLGTENVLRTGALVFLLLLLQALVRMIAEAQRVARGRLLGLGTAAALFTAVVLPGGNRPLPPGLPWLLLLLCVLAGWTLLAARPMTREELTGETEEAEKPEVRPVVMRDAPALRVQVRRNRPVVASREDPRPLSQNEVEKRMERVLVRYLSQQYRGKCYFYTHKKHS